MYMQKTSPLKKNSFLLYLKDIIIRVERGHALFPSQVNGKGHFGGRQALVIVAHHKFHAAFQFGGSFAFHGHPLNEVNGAFVIFQFRVEVLVKRFVKLAYFFGFTVHCYKRVFGKGDGGGYRAFARVLRVQVPAFLDSGRCCYFINLPAYVFGRKIPPYGVLYLGYRQCRQCKHAQCNE